LQAGIAHGGKPSLRLAIILKPPVLYWLVKALAHIVQDDPGFLVPRHGKTHAIGVTVGRHSTASASIADIAELAQFGFRWSDLIGSGASGSGKPGA